MCGNERLDAVNIEQIQGTRTDLLFHLSEIRSPLSQLRFVGFQRIKVADDDDQIRALILVLTAKLPEGTGRFEIVAGDVVHERKERDPPAVARG